MNASWKSCQAYQAWARSPLLSWSRVEEIQAFFEDDHVHMALIVAMDGRLVTTIERSDLAAAIPGSTPAAELGTLTGRTAGPADPLDAMTVALLRGRRRRLAVVDDSGRLLGLLCLKKDETGYCSDKGIRERARQARRPRDECFQDEANPVT